MEEVLEGLSRALVREIDEYNECDELAVRKERVALVQGLTRSLCDLIDSTSAAAFGMDDYYGDDEDDDVRF